MKPARATDGSGTGRRGVTRGGPAGPPPGAGFDEMRGHPECRHEHRCMTCGEIFRCGGPDDTGECAPICAACYWVELGSQLRIYRAMVAELAGKRRTLGRLAGRRACLRAQRSRRNFAQTAHLISGFGTVVAAHGAGAAAGTGDLNSPEESGEFRSGT